MAIPHQTTEDSTPFNMAALYYMHLAKIIDQKDIAYIAGDIVTRFKALNVLVNSIKFKLIKNKEVKRVEDFESKIAEVKLYLQNDIRGNTKMARQNMNSNMEKVEEILDHLDSEILLVMDKYDMLFPNIKLGGLDAVRKRYGLDAKT